MSTSLLVVLLIGVVAWLGASLGLASLFGVFLPYVAVIIFIAGVVWRMVYWSKSPVPFAIPTTGGQQASLEWIKQASLDNPSTKWGVVKRMFLEVFFFRSLFRNTYAEVREDGPRIVYFSSKWLWCFALLFHYCFLLVFIRHFRFFIDPVPACITFIEAVDGVLQIGAPRLYLTGVLLLTALLFLLGRRLFNERLRYLSLMNDYFPLLLIIALVLSGMSLRYFIKTDIASVKAFTMGLVTFQPVGAEVTKNIGSLFFVHLTYLSVLLMYFPFSKLMHAPGVFFSPTRNLPNNTRAVHHENPWNDRNAPFTTYAEYEDTFRDVMVEAGLPVEKQPDAGDKE
ncbi:MAG: sulfate reduction electron transfer complex DsrMKJOP subunit DsrM [Desulfovibrionaceae bacterium]|nr:sulfate reduction electron transfer complex DsrMKJOP subunit DsrM [Desulfovibrionaceae bacterium]